MSGNLHNLDAAIQCKIYLNPEKLLSCIPIIYKMIYLIFVLWSLSSFILFPHTETAHRLWEINTPKIDTSIIDQLHNDFNKYRDDSPEKAEKVILIAI